MKQPSLDYNSPYPDGLPGHARGDSASMAAAVAILPSATKLQALILSHLVSASDGLTVVDLVNRGLGYRYTLAPRLTELAAFGIIKKHGTRPGAERCACGRERKCRPATVWVVVR